MHQQIKMYNIQMNKASNKQFILNQSRSHKEDDFSPNRALVAANLNIPFQSQNRHFADSILKNPTSTFEQSQILGKIEKKSRQKVQWTQQQDAILFKNYIKEGSKWAQLSRILQSKTQNSIKNRFYCCIRKVQKKINLIQKKKKINHRKPVSLESLLTFLQLGKSSLDFFDGRFKNANENALEIIQVKEAIIQEAMKPQAQLNESKIEKILVQILKLKHSLKFINVRRVKKTQKISQNAQSICVNREEESGNCIKNEENIMKFTQESERPLELEKNEEPYEMIDFTFQRLETKDSVTGCENCLLYQNWEGFDHDHLLVN